MNTASLTFERLTAMLFITGHESSLMCVASEWKEGFPPVCRSHKTLNEKCLKVQNIYS